MIRWPFSPHPVPADEPLVRSEPWTEPWTHATVVEYAEDRERDLADYLDRFSKRCRTCKDVMVDPKRDVCVACRSVGER